MSTVGLILLAAGGSTRMGRPKQLLTYQGQSLLRRAAQSALAAGCHPVIVVLGAAADESTAELAGLKVTTELNPDWEKGMGSSLRCGVRALLRTAPDAAATIVMLCDQPDVTADLLRKIQEAHDATGRPVIACAYAGTIGPPCLFAASQFPRLLNVADAEGAKRLLASAGPDLHRVDFPAGARDVDTPEDYARLGAR